MGKDQELLQAVKTEDLLTVQKLLQRPRPGKASKILFYFIIFYNISKGQNCKRCNSYVFYRKPTH